VKPSPGSVVPFFAELARKCPPVPTSPMKATDGRSGEAFQQKAWISPATQAVNPSIVN